MKKYKTYKDSGIEWIGKIPEHWSLKPLKHIVECNRESLPENTPKNQLINYIEIGDVSADHGITGFEKYEFEKAPSRARRIVKEGDVLISTVRTYLKAIASIERQFDNYVVSTGFAVLTPKKVDSTYLTNIVLSNGFIGEIISLSKGVSYPSITSSDLLQIKVPFPSSLEQEDIGAYLDQKTEEIDTLIAKKEQLIKLLEEERTAMINQAVTKGLDPNVPMKDSGIDWLGEIPEHWEVKKLKFVSEVVRGKFTHRPRNDTRLYGGKYPFIQTGDVAKAGKYLSQYSQTLNELGFNVSKQFSRGTIVMTIAANIGDISILDIDACFPDSIVGFYPKMGIINNDFMYFVLLALREEFYRTSISNTQLNLNIERISNIHLALPTFNEQSEIIESLVKKLGEMKLLKIKLKEEIILLKEYKTTLISEVVTGKIDIRQEVLN